MALDFVMDPRGGGGTYENLDSDAHVVFSFAFEIWPNAILGVAGNQSYFWICEDLCHF